MKVIYSSLLAEVMISYWISSEFIVGDNIERNGHTNEKKEHKKGFDYVIVVVNINISVLVLLLRQIGDKYTF